MGRGCVVAAGFLAGALLAVVLGLGWLMLANSGPPVAGDSGGRAMGTGMLFLQVTPFACIIFGAVGAHLAWRWSRPEEDE